MVFAVELVTYLSTGKLTDRAKLGLILTSLALSFYFLVSEFVATSV